MRRERRAGDLRPIADVAPGDNRLPLMWTGRNHDQVRRVLERAYPHLEHKDAQAAGSIILRLKGGTNALSLPSTEEVERIDRLLVLAYDLGVRP